MEANVVDLSIDGLTPRELLAAIRKASLELDEAANKCLHRKLLPQLDKAGNHILDYDKLTKTQREKADAYFHEVIYPVLTPLALDLAGIQQPIDMTCSSCAWMPDKCTWA